MQGKEADSAQYTSVRGDATLTTCLFALQGEPSVHHQHVTHAGFMRGLVASGVSPACEFQDDISLNA